MTLKLHIRYRIKGFDGIVIDRSGNVWQLPYFNKYQVPLRKKEPFVREGKNYYRLKRKYVSENRLNQLAYISDETIDTGILIDKQKPFK